LQWEVECVQKKQNAEVVERNLSSNPKIGSWESWAPSLQHACKLGLKLTLHAPEVSAQYISLKDVGKTLITMAVTLHESSGQPAD